MREVAVRHGMRSLSDDGWRLIGMGITTPEEVMRVDQGPIPGQRQKRPRPNRSRIHRRKAAKVA